MKKKHRRGKRKSRTEIYRGRYKLRATPAYHFITRIPQIVSGGNPFGLSEYTLMVARGPARVA